MTLRARIFLLGSSILLLLLAAEWWLVDGLRQRFRSESAEIAREVGLAVLEDNDWLKWADAQRAQAAARRENAAIEARVADTAVDNPHMQPARRVMPAVPGVRIPNATARLDAMTRDFQIDMAVGSLAILLVGIVATAFMAHRLSAPLQSLGEAAAAIGAGRFGAQAQPSGEPRFDAAIEAFNAMSSRLAVLEAEARDAQERSHLTELGEIARGIAHSLRNPLHALGLSLTELTSPSTESQPRAELAQTCQQQIERIDHTLRSFLSLSAANGQVPGPIDITDLLQDVLMEAAQTTGGRVHIACELGAVRPRIQGNGTELRTAVHVLVLNAIEASPAGGTVTIRLEPEELAVRIVVEDEGPGLSEIVRERLFQPHVTTKSEGAGLGLFLAERIARRRYGGSLELADRPDRGMRAVLTLRDAAHHA
jgi:signal transduction histidine kinase